MNLLLDSISWLKIKIQKNLFPHVEECVNEPVTDKQKRLMTTLEAAEIERYVKAPELQRMGRKLKDRYAIARAFIAKSVYGFPTTRALHEALETMPNLRMICGFSGYSVVSEYEGKTADGRVLTLKRKKSAIPSEATFSRAFAEFSEIDLGDRGHEGLVQEYLSDEIIGHISRDSTAILGNEKPVIKREAIEKAKQKKKKKHKKETKESKAAKKEKKRERSMKGEEVTEGKAGEVSKEIKRLDIQLGQSYEEALKELPKDCNVGCKTNSQGYKETWIGYKLHIDTNDCGLPVTAVLTSASLHDSQVAIPMMKETTGRVIYLYDLMDSAYDAHQIYDTSKDLGHVPIIDKNKRRGEVLPMSPAEAARYKERSAAERLNSRLKGEFGGETVMVRGHKKVKLHLMFGLIALFVDQLMKLAT